MNWKLTRNGMVWTLTKGVLSMIWDIMRHSYRVLKDGHEVERGRTPRLVLPTFLAYIELTWN